jgi:hypothetical protein
MNEEPALKAAADRRVIELMDSLGADFTEPTEVNHYLYFPDEGSAVCASIALLERGFDVEVGEPLPKRNEWLVLATHRAVVSESSVNLLRHAMERVADDNRGRYDGWEALIESGASL